jgi:adenylate cyclase
MGWRLHPEDGTAAITLPASATRSVGRTEACDIPVPDTTVSRRHAELVTDAEGLLVRDLGSANGTYVNDAPVGEARLAAGDRLRFGQCGFRVEADGAPSGPPRPAAVAGAGIVRQVPMPAPGVVGPVDEADRTQRKLSLLLQVSTALAKARDVDALLAQIVAHVFQVLPADRAAILLCDGAGRLEPRLSRDARGGEASRPVPQSIARTAVDERVAILSDDAGEDLRFTGQSILLQQVRSAMCVPLLDSEGRPLGVLYVDSNARTTRFGDDDLAFLVAFAGLAAVAIENAQFALRLRQEAVVRSNFERFFTPQLAERIATAPDAVRLGGDKRRVTVLFSDIRGFTALSETMNPDTMARLLTEYFTEMVDCVFRHGGTLDKFIGDAVMAQWGAPLGAPDDADRALAAAIDMQRALGTLNARWSAEGRPVLAVGIGLNTGEAFAGNIGAERRLEYTVIGDTVNTASRLCAAADGGEILVSEALRAALGQAPPLQPRAPLTLKGKAQPVPVYAVPW